MSAHVWRAIKSLESAKRRKLENADPLEYAAAQPQLIIEGSGFDARGGVLLEIDLLVQLEWELNGDDMMDCDSEAHQEGRNESDHFIGIRLPKAFFTGRNIRPWLNHGRILSECELGVPPAP